MVKKRSKEEVYLEMLHRIAYQPDMKQTNLMFCLNLKHYSGSPDDFTIKDYIKRALYHNHIKGVVSFRITKIGLDFLIYGARSFYDLKEVVECEMPKKRTIVSDDEDCDYNQYQKIRKVS